jgi:hypothetical protein
MARLFMNKSVFKMDGKNWILLSLWGLSLVDIYAKMKEHGTLLTRCHLKMWSLGMSYLGGCAMHGYGNEVLKHLETHMCEASVQPDDITFVLSSVNL